MTRVEMARCDFCERVFDPESTPPEILSVTRALIPAGARYDAAADLWHQLDVCGSCLPTVNLALSSALRARRLAVGEVLDVRFEGPRADAERPQDAPRRQEPR